MGVGNVVNLLAALGRGLMNYVTSLGLAALFGLSILGVILVKWTNPTLTWVTVLCASVAVFALRAYLDSDGRPAFKIMLVSALCLLALPPLWVGLSMASEPRLAEKTDDSLSGPPPNPPSRATNPSP